jgi:fluoride exporter
MTGTLTWVGIGALGALGAYARFYVGGAVTARRPSDFPLGTFVVNLTGSLALGVLVGMSAEETVLLLVGTGLLGGYTTFSTWMVEAQRLGEDAAWTPMWLYLVGSMLAGVATAGLGWIIGAAIG